MNITQPMDYPTIMNYELRIMNLSRHARPMRRTTYDTHVRASLREGVLSDAWISQQLRIMHYELCIIKGVSKRNHHILIHPYNFSLLILNS